MLDWQIVSQCTWSDERILDPNETWQHLLGLPLLCDPPPPTPHHVIYRIVESLRDLCDRGLIWYGYISVVMRFIIGWNISEHRWVLVVLNGLYMLRELNERDLIGFASELIQAPLVALVRTAVHLTGVGWRREMVPSGVGFYLLCSYFWIEALLPGQYGAVILRLTGFCFFVVCTLYCAWYDSNRSFEKKVCIYVVWYLFLLYSFSGGFDDKDYELAMGYAVNEFSLWVVFVSYCMCNPSVSWLKVLGVIYYPVCYWYAYIHAGHDVANNSVVVFLLSLNLYLFSACLITACFWFFVYLLSGWIGRCIGWGIVFALSVIVKAFLEYARERETREREAREREGGRDAGREGVRPAEFPPQADLEAAQ